MSSEIIDKAIKIIPHGDISASNIINESTRKRYIGINKAIFLPLRVNKDGYNEKILDYKCDDFERLMTCWITLGSAIESSLQIFLTIFKHNYYDNPANKWCDFDKEFVESSILTCIDEMGNNNILRNKQKRQLKKK